MENYILEKIYGKLYSGKNLWKTIFWKKFMENYILEKTFYGFHMFLHWGTKAEAFVRQ